MVDRHRRLPREGLDRLAAALRPGSTVTRTRRLPGGASARVLALDLSGPSGERFRAVLRFPPEHHQPARETAIREFRTLQLLESAGLAAPRPLLLDADGDFLGEPAIVMTYLGRPLVEPRHVVPWLAELAGALVALHRITPQQHDLAYLGSARLDDLHESVARTPPALLADDALEQAVSQALCDGIDRVTWLPRCLMHNDYWPGNTVWRRNRLAGIVDWTTAEIGDPRVDVAQCRADLALMHGLEYADGFLAAYEAASGAILPDLWFFDLLRGRSAYENYEAWYLPGYRDLGMKHLTAALLGERIRAFLSRASEEADAAASASAVTRPG